MPNPKFAKKRRWGKFLDLAFVLYTDMFAPGAGSQLARILVSEFYQKSRIFPMKQMQATLSQYAQYMSECKMT